MTKKPQRIRHVAVATEEQSLIMALYLNMVIMPDEKELQKLKKRLRAYLRKHKLVDYKDRPFYIVEL